MSYKLYEEYLDIFVHLYETADFFNIQVNDINKDQIRVTDVGITTLTYRAHGKERSLSYGYVENNPLEELVRFYGQIAQEYLPPISPYVF